MSDTDRFGGWFIVELMGRKKTAGYVAELSIAGAGFLRIDVPLSDDQPRVTQFVRPETVYALTPTTEEIATRVARHYRPEPVYAFEIREPSAKDRAAIGYQGDEDDNEIDDDEE